MARTRKSPFHRKPVDYEPQEVTGVILLFIPYLHAYYRDKFEIFKACLHSMRRNAGRPLDIMVVDNGSHPRVKRYLLDRVADGTIQHLVSNDRNLGYGPALNMAFRAVQSRYIAFSNDDVFFLPGWLDDELAILEAFPDAGLAGGQTIPDTYSAEASREYAARHGIEARAFALPRAELEDWAGQIGTDADTLLAKCGGSDSMELLERNGAQAVRCYNGYQYLFPRSLLDRIPPFRNKKLGTSGQDMEFFQAIFSLGLHPLCTRKGRNRHIGDRLTLKEVSLFRMHGYRIPSGALLYKLWDPRELRVFLSGTRLAGLLRALRGRS